jgi:hypothetical protein
MTDEDRDRIERLGRVIRNGAEQIAGEIEDPETDWQMVFFMETPEDVLVAPVPPQITEDNDAKAQLAEMMAASVRQLKAYTVGMVATSWTRTAPCTLCGRGWEDEAHHERATCPYEPGPLDMGLRPSEDPNRGEAVNVVVWTAEGQATWMAPILRSADRPPKLRPWLGGELIDHPENVPTMGKFMDATVPELRELAA